MSERRIVIEEVGRPRVPDAPKPSNRWDLQDGLVLMGLFSAEAAALVIWWPAALIILALFCFGSAAMIEISRRKQTRIMRQKMERLKEKRGAA